MRISLLSVAGLSVAMLLISLNLSCTKQPGSATENINLGNAIVKSENNTSPEMAPVAPAVVPAEESLPVIDATDTEKILKYYGQKVRVEGKVIQFNTVYDDNKRPLMLQFTPYDLEGDDWQNSQAGTFFKAMLYKENDSKFPAIDECYQQNIMVEGVIEIFKSAPVIILKDPAQLQFEDKQPEQHALPSNLENSKILFVSDRDSFKDPLNWGYDGKGEIYVMNADGSNAVKLTSSGGSNRCPAWSPDQKRIAFMSDRDTQYENGWDIYTMNSDGSEVTRLTKNHARNMNPQWSPDGKQIAFASDFGATGKLQIYTMNVDGSEMKQVTFTPFPTSCYGPCFTSDGKEIIFVSNLGGSYAISKLDPSTGNVANLTLMGNKECAWPAISPDGQKIVYYRDDSVNIDLMNPNYKIHVMNIDGTNDKCISFNPPDEMIISDFYPSWSPDGSKIIFSSNRSPGFWQRQTTTTRRLWVSQIYIMDADGSNMYRLPHIWGDDWFPTWK